MMTPIHRTKELNQCFSSTDNITPKTANLNIKNLITFVDDCDKRGVAHFYYGKTTKHSFSQASEKVLEICDSYNSALLWFEAVPPKYQTVWFQWLVMNYPTFILKSLSTNITTLKHMTRCFSQLTDAQIYTLVSSPNIDDSSAIIGLILLGLKYERVVKILQTRKSLIKKKFERNLVDNIEELLHYGEMIEAQWLLHMVVYHPEDTGTHFLAINAEQKEDIIASFHLLPVDEFLKKAPSGTLLRCVTLLLPFIQPEKLSNILLEFPPAEYAKIVSKICSSYSYADSYFILLRMHQNFSKSLFFNAAYFAFHFLKIEEYITLTSVLHQKCFLTRDDNHFILQLFPDRRSIIAGLTASSLNNLLLLSLLNDAQHLSSLGLDQATSSIILKIPSTEKKIEGIMTALKHKTKSSSSTATQHTAHEQNSPSIQEIPQNLLSNMSFTAHTHMQKEAAFNDEEILEFLGQVLDEPEPSSPQQNTLNLSTELDDLLESFLTEDFNELPPSYLPVLFESSSSKQEKPVGSKKRAFEEIAPKATYLQQKR